MTRYHILSALTLLLLAGGVSLRAQVVVSVDPSSVLGPVKPMNAANNGPTDSQGMDRRPVAAGVFTLEAEKTYLAFAR